MKFTVIGGDMRMVALVSALENEGHEVCTYALEKAPDGMIKCCGLTAELASCGADCIILPLPVLNSRGTLNAPYSAFSHDIQTIIRQLPKDSIVCAGKPDERLKHLAAELSIDLVDYFEREELVALNALATAEGAISVLLRNSPITVWESSMLIIGAGRIGKMLAERLRALGAYVTVSARKASDMAYIRAMGCNALDTRTLCEELSQFDTVINTVPALVLDKEKLGHLKSDVLLIDLASSPGGFDFEAARELDLNTLWVLGLPAETAPITAGKIIKETVLNIIEERRGG